MSASQVIQNLIVRLSGDAKHYQTMLKNAQGMTKTAGKAMTKYLTLPLVGIGVMAVREFAKFDQAMTESTSIMKVTTEQIQRMRDTALELAKGSIKGPEELARSYFYLASAGLDAEQAMAALPVVMNFATAGAFDMARATDLLTDAQSALGMTSKNATENMANMARLSDVLVKANTLANASVEQFSIALTSKAGSAFKTFGISVEEGVALLAAFADQGIKAELAGNTTSRALLMLSKASRSNANAWKDAKLEMYDAAGNVRHLADIVENLEDVLHGMSPEMKAATLETLGFEARIQGAILPLLGTSKAIRRYDDELKQAGGTTREVAEKQLKSFSNQLKITWNNIKVAAIAIGQELAPKVLLLNKYLKDAADKWNSLTPATRSWIVQIGVMVAVIGPALLVISKLIGLVSLLQLKFQSMIAFLAANPIAFAILAGAAAVVWLGTAIHNALPSIKRLRAEMEHMGKQHERVMTRMQKQHQETMDVIMKAGTTEEKNTALEDAVAAGKAEVRRYAEEVERASARVAELNQQWFPGQVALEHADQVLQQSLQRQQASLENVQNLEKMRIEAQQDAVKAAAEASNEYADGLAAAQEGIDEYIKSLEEMSATMGMTDREAEIWKLANAHEGITDAMLEEARVLDKLLTSQEEFEKLMKDGKKVVDENLEPLTKLKKEQEDLYRLLDVGAIDRGTFDRANKAALDEYEQALERINDKANVKLRMDTTAVRAGSEDYEKMLAGIGSFEAKFSGKDDSKAKREEAMEEHLRRIREIEEERQRKAAQMESVLALSEIA